MNPGTEETASQEIDESSLEGVNPDDIKMGDSLEDNTPDADTSDDSTSGEDDKPTENSDDAGGDNSNSDDNSDQSAKDSEGDSSETSATDDVDVPLDEGDDLTEVEAFSALSDETGVQVSTDEDIVTSLKELATLRESGGATSNLSSAIQEAIRVEQNGGDLADHFARVGMDFDKMDGREVLRQQFFKTEAKLYKNNPKLAQMKFDRGFTAKYGNLIAYNALPDQDAKDSFLEDKGVDLNDLEYEKLGLESDTALAKEELEEWKKTAAPVVQEKSQSNEWSEEEKDTYAAAHQAKVKKSWSGFEALTVEMGEGLNDFLFGLNETTKPIVEGWMSNPGTFLEDIGIHGQEIDLDILLPVMTAVVGLSEEGDFGARLAKHVVHSENIETFRKVLDKPKAAGSPAADQNRGAKDDWDAIGDAAEAAGAAAQRQ